MPAEYELVQHTSLQHVHFLVNRITYRSLHLHNEIELTLCLEGEGVYHTPQAEYPLYPGSLTLLNSYEPQDIVGKNGPVTLLILQFSSYFLEDYYPSLATTRWLEGDLRKVMPKDRADKAARLLLDAGIEYLTRSEYFELSCVSKISELIKLLLIFAPKESLTSGEQYKMQKQIRRMLNLSEYVAKNFQNPIRLADLAKEEGVTETHLSHFFREHFGLGFQEYLNVVRLEHAVRLLDVPAKTLTDISAEAGFSELKYMTRMFERQFGMKPAEFREQVNRRSLPTRSVSGNGSTLESIFTEQDALDLLLETWTQMR